MQVFEQIFLTEDVMNYMEKNKANAVFEVVGGRNRFQLKNLGYS